MLASSPPPVSVYFKKVSSKKIINSTKDASHGMQRRCRLTFLRGRTIHLKNDAIEFFHWSIFFDASLVLIIAIKHANR